MQIKQLTKIAEYVIRIEPGEKLMASLEKFMRDVQGGYATFHIPTGGGIAGIDCYFSEEKDKGGSKEHRLPGPMELGGTGGNISWDPNKPNTPIVHYHIGLGSEDGLKGYVAHLKEATVNLTAEIKIEVYKEKVFRKLDEKLGLELLDLPSGPAKRIKEGRQGLHEARREFLKCPLFYQGEALLHIDWFGSGGANIKSSYDKYDLEVAIIREALDIWDGKNYNANNIKNLLSNNSPERTNDVDVVLQRLKGFKNRTDTGWRDSTDGTQMLRWREEELEAIEKERDELRLKVKNYEAQIQVPPKGSN